MTVNRGVVRTPLGLKSNISVPVGLPDPLCWMPLISTLELFRGTGVATFTRSTIGTFEDKDTVDVLVKTAAIDAARFDKEGFLHQGSSENKALNNRDFTDADWATPNITPLKDAVGADGVANAASSLEATAGNATALQTVTIDSAQFTYSIDVRRKSGTGTIEITDDNGSNFTDITTSINDTTYTRFQLTRTQENPIFGVRIVTSGDEIEVDYAQLENKKSVTSRIETAGIPVTRTIDTSQIPTANAPADADFTVSVIVKVDDVEGSGEFVWGIAPMNARTFATSTGDARFEYGGVGDADITGAFGIEQKWTFVYSKANSEFNHYIDGVKDPNAPISITPDASAITAIFLGSNQTGAQPLFGHIRDFRIYDVALTDAQVKVI